MRALTPETALISTSASASTAAAAALRPRALASSPPASLRASYDPAAAERLAEACSGAATLADALRALRCAAGLERGLLPLALGGWRVGGRRVGGVSARLRAGLGPAPAAVPRVPVLAREPTASRVGLAPRWLSTGRSGLRERAEARITLLASSPSMPCSDPLASSEHAEAVRDSRPMLMRSELS